MVVNVKLRCNTCLSNVNEVCLKYKEPLRNGYMKLSLGGIIDDPNHVGQCQTKFVRQKLKGTKQVMVKYESETENDVFDINY